MDPNLKPCDVVVYLREIESDFMLDHARYIVGLGADYVEDDDAFEAWLKATATKRGWDLRSERIYVDDEEFHNAYMGIYGTRTGVPPV